MDYLIHFTPDFKPSISTVQNDFNERLQLVNGSKMMGPYVIADSPSANLFKGKNYVSRVF